MLTPQNIIDYVDDGPTNTGIVPGKSGIEGW